MYILRFGAVEPIRATAAFTGGYPFIGPAPYIKMETDREFSSVVSLPQFPGPSIVTRRNASDDPDQGTAETVHAMQAGAVEDSNTPQVWAATKGALASAAGSSRRDIAAAVYRWICSHVKFRSDDPVLSALLGLDNELDLLIRPARLLTMSRPAEDCDGFTMLCCSMLLAAGVPCEIITIKADHEDPTRYSHVYCQAILEDGPGLVMDCSQGAQHGFPLGWEAPEYFARKDWGVIHPVQAKGLHGLGAEYDYGGEYGYGDVLSGGPTLPDYIPEGGSWSWSAPGWGAPSAPWGGYGGGSGSGGGGGSAGSGSSIAAILASVAAAGGRLAQQVNLPRGYALMPDGAVVPAGGYVGGSGVISPTVLLIGGGVLLAAVLLGRK